MDVEEAIEETSSSQSKDVKDITPEKDGGVLKKVIKQGSGRSSVTANRTAGNNSVLVTGWKYPNSGNKVTVHYVGKLTDGTVFDSSRDRGDQFTFTVGKGEVIKGWDVAVKSMKRGEVALFTLKPEYAYGETGSPPKIPPNSTLEFEIELFDWELEDLTKKKDGGVRKTILQDGTGFVNPNDGSTVECHLVGKFGDKEFENRDVSFVVGEGIEMQVVEGIELAVTHMKKGEKAQLLIKRAYAWGDTPPAEFGLPADYEEVQYEVELKSFEKRKETWEMDNDERLEQAELAKNKGTAYFKQGKFALALKQYKLIPQNLGPPDNSDFEKNEKKDQVLLAGYLNLAMTYLKLNKPLEVINNCVLALSMDPNNEKGLFRRGQAYYSIKEFEKAKADFERVLKHDPQNTAAKHQLAQCMAAIKAHHEKEKQTYKGMFTKFAHQDLEKERRQARDVWKDLKDEDKREFKSDADTNGDASNITNI